MEVQHVKAWKNTGLLGIIIIITGLITGCVNGPSTEEKIFENLENVVGLEEEFKNQQSPLLELEQQEKEKYDEILSLGMKEHEKIVELADQAIAISEERKELLDKERSSIVEAEKEFQKVQDLIEEIDDENLKKQAESFYGIMVKRYETHTKLYNKYLEGIESDKKLYEMLKQEDITLEVLEPQIESINQTYQEVYTLNEEFNTYTEDYNGAKVKFYEDAGLNIELREDEN